METILHLWLSFNQPDSCLAPSSVDLNNPLFTWCSPSVRGRRLLVVLCDSYQLFPALKDIRSAATTHIHVHAEGKRERLRAPHNEGTLSAGSRVTFRTPTALLLHKEFSELWNYSRFMSKGICTWNWDIFCALIHLNRGTHNWRGKHGVFHGTSTEGALLATF